MVYTGNLVHGLLLAETADGRARARVLDRRRRAVRAARRSSQTVRDALAAEGLAVSRRHPSASRASPASSPSRSTARSRATGRYVQAVHVLGELKDTIACDISRARKELGYEPTVALLEGMRASVRWCLERGCDSSDGALGARHRRQRLLRQPCSSARAPRPGRRASAIFDVNPPDAEHRRASSTSRATSATAPRCAPRATASTSCSTTSPRCRSRRTASCSTR